MIARSYGERGQATVELALCVPVLVLLCLILAQVGSVMIDQLAVQQAAREAARSAAVDPRQGAAVAAAQRATGLDVSRLTAEVGPRPASDGLVHVTVSYRSEIVLPFSHAVLLTPVVRAEAAMRVENPW